MADTEKKAEPGIGDIVVDFDGSKITLKPTLEACIRLNNLHNSLNLTKARVENYDFETICQVIAAGVGANPEQMKRLVQPGVFRTGMIDLVPVCIEFIGVVINGGRPLPELPEVGEDADAPLATESQ